MPYFHSKRIINRDMKLESTLFNSNNQAKLSDFGLYRLIKPFKFGFTCLKLFWILAIYYYYYY